MSVEDEFATVDLVLNSNTATLGVDAFALSLIKAEKQARRLLTYLVYQHAWCTTKTIPELKDALEASNHVYFAGVLRGWNALFPRSIEDLVGTDYSRLKARLDEATGYRNKIFHGQLTPKGLSRTQLVSLAKDIRAWCMALGYGAQSAVGYDGCGRDSFRKSRNAATVCAMYKQRIQDVTGYRAFIRKYMER